MSAAIVNLSIEQGAVYAFTATWTEPIPEGSTGPAVPHDITGFKGRMQIRSEQQGTIFVEATTENGKILIPTGTDGKFRVKLGASDTGNISLKKTVYDLELWHPTTPEDVYRVIQGAVTCSRNITQDVGEPVVK